MRQSELFTKTLKEAPREEEAVNARLLAQAGFVDKTMAGVYSFLPLGLRVLKNVERIVREEMMYIGGEEVLMPSLQPKANWQTTGRWETVDDLFKFTSFYSRSDLVLGGTHEEIIAPLVKKFLPSYRDLPRAIFQIQTKFRDEKRPKSGLLRGREFVMKDLYSFHEDEADLDRYYEKAKRAYQKIFRRAGIAKKTYLTYASGGTFSQYSHEFQTITPAGEDTIFICSGCRVAINKEIAGSDPACPVCGRKELDSQNTIEVGNIFKLKDKFSKPFGLRFKTAEGEEKDVLMGCYGLGLNRLIGTIVEVSHDDRGIIWPESVAPFRFHLLELKKGIGQALYRKLTSSGASVLYDDRAVSAGEKFADADLIGLPWRIVVSEKTGSKMEVKSRKSKKSQLVNYDFIRKLG